MRVLALGKMVRDKLGKEILARVAARHFAELVQHPGRDAWCGEEPREKIKNVARYIRGNLTLLHHQIVEDHPMRHGLRHDTRRSDTNLIRRETQTTARVRPEDYVDLMAQVACERKHGTPPEGSVDADVTRDDL